MTEIAANILNFLCTCNEAFWLFYIVNQLLEKRKTTGKIWIDKLISGAVMAGLVGIGITLNSIVLTSPYTTLIAICYSVICIWAIWKSDFFTAIAITGGYFFLLFLVGMLEILLTGWIGGTGLILATAQEQGLIRCIYLLLGGTCWFIFNFFISQRIKKLRWKGGKKSIILILLAGIGSMFFLAIQVLEDFDIIINLLILGFILIFAIIIIIFYYVTKNKQWKLEREAIKERDELMEQKYNELSQYYISNAKLYHDMNHHLQVICSMAEAGKINDVIEYVREINIMTESVHMKAWTGIDIIDTILNEKEHMAVKQGIAMEIKADMIPADMRIKNQDLCSLFANLLSNALEAKAENIEVLVKVVGQMLLVQVKNDYRYNPVIKDGRYQTHKESKNHGWGIKNIEDIAEKYGGSLEIKNQEGIFEVDILINLY